MFSDESMVWFNVNPAIYRAVQYVFALITLYILSGLLRHLCRLHCHCCVCTQGKNVTNRRGNCYRNAAETKENPGLSREPSYRRKTQDKNYKAASITMLALSIVTCILALMHVLVDVWVFSVQDRLSTDLFCVRQTLSGLLYFLCVLCVYLFLWIRQRMFYSHPVLRHLSGPRLACFSWSVLVCIVITMSTFIALYFVPHFMPEWNGDGFGTEMGNNNQTETVAMTVPTEPSPTFSGQPSCFYRRKKIYLVLHLLLTLVCLYFQIALQFLFAYPVFCHRRHLTKMHRKRFEVRSNETKSDAKVKIPPRNVLSCPALSDYQESSQPLTSSNQRQVKDDFVTISSRETDSSVPIGAKRTLSDSCLLHSRTDLDTRDGSLKISDRPNSLQKIQLATTGDVKLERAVQKSKKRSRNANQSKDATSLKKRNYRFAVTANLRKDRCLTKRKAARAPSIRQKTPGNARLRHYVVRCFVMSLICCVSDLIAFGFSLYTQMSAKTFYMDIFRNQTTDYFGNDVINHTTTGNAMLNEKVTISLLSALAYNGNMIINLFCVLLCYDDWRSMLFPCCAEPCENKRCCTIVKSYNRKKLFSTSSTDAGKSGESPHKETSVTFEN
ncbi:unnamed protein product [Clavelina lepadiformis]|uniref:Uncharacterized protein n=1 Tax=Clavelina lepadiformis TaxID=159417 RepID=A0ABP0FR15_CLALP